MSYVLHYAPDNASLIVRLALEHRGLEYETRLVDRSARAQEGAAYKRINPLGLIPALETPRGVLFETGAILLWLADTHGGLGPAPDDTDRGDFLKWLFYLANTVHTAERMLFYPEKFIAAGQEENLQDGMRRQIASAFETLERVAGEHPPWLGGKAPTVLDFYLAALLRWPAIYPRSLSPGWHNIGAYPHLKRVCEKLEALPCTQALQMAEGLGKRPFTDPRHPNPPQGSAT